MDKEIRNIFENYQETWSLSPKESFKRDKEFFQYVIESNPHLAPLREFKLKYIFELYKAKLRQELDLDAPGLVNESYNISNEDAFNVLEEMTSYVPRFRDSSFRSFAVQFIDPKHTSFLCKHTYILS